MMWPTKKNRIVHVCVVRAHDGKDEIRVRASVLLVPFCFCSESCWIWFLRTFNGRGRWARSTQDIEDEYKRKETCLIGDSINDLEAAKLNEIEFYGYNNPSLVDKCEYIVSFSE